MNNWGYETEGGIEMIIDAADFAVLTGGALSATTETVEAVLIAASAAIRDYCGWHIGPAARCSWKGDADGRLVELPTMGVQSVQSVKVDGNAVGYDVKPRTGLIRLREPIGGDGWGNRVEVEFVAGYDTDAIGVVVAQIATNFLVASPGVSAEAIDGVSITYNRTASGVSGGVRLLPSDKALLEPYRLV